MTAALLTDRQAASQLGVSQSFLKKHRQTGFGPPFVRLSSRCCRYRQEDLDRWVEDRVRTSTSDTGLVR